MEILLTVAASILFLVFVVLFALCVRWKLIRPQREFNNQPIYVLNTETGSGGIYTTNPYARPQSLACTYQAGVQVDISPLPGATPPIVDYIKIKPFGNTSAQVAVPDPVEGPMPGRDPHVDGQAPLNDYQPHQDGTDTEYPQPGHSAQDVAHGQAIAYIPLSESDQTDISNNRISQLIEMEYIYDQSESGSLDAEPLSPVAETNAEGKPTVNPGQHDEIVQLAQSLSPANSLVQGSTSYL